MRLSYVVHGHFMNRNEWAACWSLSHQQAWLFFQTVNDYKLDTAAKPSALDKTLSVKNLAPQRPFISISLPKFSKRLLTIFVSY
jgi:hypothetical protein